MCESRFRFLLAFLSLFLPFALLCPVSPATAQTYEKLVGCRRAPLQAIKSGFSRVDMSLWLKGLNCTELMLLLCGEDYLDADMVLQNVVFSSSFADGSPVPGFLKQFLQESDITGWSMS